MTGYSLLKHVQIDYTGSLDAEFKGATPAIQFRYAAVSYTHLDVYKRQRYSFSGSDRFEIWILIDND